jgi:iron complex outermembrane receptor protein
MEIVTADDIRRTGARTIPEALKGIAGVDVWQSGITDFNVGIRGDNSYLNPTVLVMVNGRQVYLDHFGYTSWGSIPVAMNEIRQIEVVKGPNTALFGFNAAAGVINIITFDPAFDKKDNVTVTGGSGADYRGSIMKTLSIGEHSGVRISTNGMAASDFNNNIQASDVRESQVWSRAVNLDGHFEVTDKTMVTIDASHAINRTNEMIAFNSFNRQNYELNSFDLGIIQETENWGTIDFSAYYNSLGNEIGFASGSSFDVVNKVAVVKLQDLFKIGANHTLRIAGEYRNNTMETLQLGTADIAYDVYSASAMWDWMINDSMSWTNAARVDKLYLGASGTLSASSPLTLADYDRDLTVYSANSGLVYKMTANDTIGVSYGRGAQVPSLTTLGSLEISAAPLYIGGAP